MAVIYRGSAEHPGVSTAMQACTDALTSWSLTFSHIGEAGGYAACYAGESGGGEPFPATTVEKSTDDGATWAFSTCAEVACTTGPPPPAETPSPSTQTINCSGTCTLTVTHEIVWPEALTGLTTEKATDYLALWSAFVVAAVVVLGAKAIYNRFRIDHGDI